MIRKFWTASRVLHNYHDAARWTDHLAQRRIGQRPWNKSEGYPAWFEKYCAELNTIMAEDLCVNEEGLALLF